eukprot:TRINITY_DN25347_c0_g1_i1.p1 TRINITY_DN25347_c0_g1~~TRINITY_DN25347_c0_g1_i1.p1  ORF type:complete len:402 (+),score=59.41 TRINITY_DN25347_c0_g1_i1:105-1310(+)
MRCVLLVIISVLLTLPSDSLQNNNNGSKSNKSPRGRFLSRSHFYFSMDLYESLSQVSSPDSNILFSPFNAYALLSEIFLGTLASSNSSAQIRSSLHLSQMSYVNIHSGFRDLLASFAGGLPRGISAVRELFLRSNVSLNPLYAKGLEEYYGTTVSRFEEDPHRSIEAWAASKSLQFPLPGAGHGDFFSGQVLSVFCEEWENHFVLESQPSSFTLAGGEKLSLPMMTSRGSFPHGYSQELECRVLEIPFRHRRLSLFILLPDKLDSGISDLERELNKDNMQLMLSKLENNPLTVRLPRFQISSSIQLDQPLQNLGILDIFSKDHSELSLIAPGQDLYISSIFHKSSFVARESSSSTPSNPEPFIHPPDEETFNVDHPFVFLVWDYYSGMLLLMGRVNRPNAA